MSVSIIEIISCCVQPEGLDAEADREADKIVEELTSGILSPAGAAPVNTVKKSAAAGAQEVQVRRNCGIDNARNA